MPKVLHRNGKCYEQVAPNSLHELDIERKLLIHSEILYPEHYILPYKISVETEDGDSAKPDLAFIAKDYREWWVIEVEMGDHQLEGHVLRQIEVFSSGVYGERDAKYFIEKQPLLNEKLLINLITSEPPKVMVILNTEPKPNWYQELARFGATIAVFEEFRAEDEDEVFRLKGEHLTKFVEMVTECFYEPLYPNILRIDLPDKLGVHTQQTVKLRYEDYITEWERVDSQNKVWLIPKKRNPLPMRGKTKYILFRHLDGSLTIKVSDQ